MLVWDAEAEYGQSANIKEIVDAVPHDIISHYIIKTSNANDA